ncbi:MAG: mechanosensitive ion channel [Cyclobacteriaceae bacterium]
MKEDVSGFIEKLIQNGVILLPKIVVAIIVLAVGYIIARIVEKLVRKLIVYLNQTLNAKLQASLLNVDLKASAKFISKIIFWFILLLAVLICLQILDLKFLSYWFDRLIAYVPNVIVAVVIIFFGIITGRLLGDLIKSAVSKTGIANGSYMGRAVRYLILFVAVVVALDQLGVNIGFLTNLFLIILTSLLFGASLAFGLGAKNSIKNIFGSYYVRKTFEIGMKIRYGKLEGVIVKISEYAILIESLDGVVVIPAKNFSNENITIVKEEL